MISKTKIKFIKSLQLKKNREQTHLFIAEGHKLVEELLAMSRAHTLVATQEWLANHSAPPADEVIEVTSDELRKVSLLQHPQQVLGLFPFFASDTHAINTSTLSLMLDGIQDPGNLGTISITSNFLLMVSSSWAMKAMEYLPKSGKWSTVHCLFPTIHPMLPRQNRSM